MSEEKPSEMVRRTLPRKDYFELLRELFEIEDDPAISSFNISSSRDGETSLGAWRKVGDEVMPDPSSNIMFLAWDIVEE